MVTSTIAFEGDGRIVEYVGGYEDWLRQRPQPVVDTPVVTTKAATVSTPAAPAATAPAGTAAAPRKATNKERLEREALPAKIEALEAELKRLEAETASPDFYKKPAAEITATMARLEALPDEILGCYARWDELEPLR